MANERETTLEAIKTMCEKIIVVNGFSNDVQEVLRKFVLPDPAANNPRLMVLGGSEEYLDDLGESTNTNMKVIIRGYAQDKSEPEKALTSLIKDVLKVIESVYNTEKVDVKPIRTDTDEGWLNVDMEGMAMFDMELLAQYRFLRSDP